MSLTNDFAKSYFKTGQHGGCIFFPYGNFGRGYLLPSGELQEALIGFIRTFSIITGVCFTAAGIFLGVAITMELELLSPLLLLVLLTLLSSIWYEYQTRKILAGAERSAEKMSFQEYLLNISSAISKRGIYLLLFGSGVLAALNLFFLVELDGGRFELVFACWFIFSALVLLHLLKLKNLKS